MYCKNCGRQLKEGTRFCDRCGHSVRKSKQSAQATKRQEIEALKAERLNRKKRLEEKEAKQARNKKRKKSGGGAFLFFVVVILIAIFSVVLGFSWMNSGSKDNNTNNNNSYNVDTTSLPGKTPVPKQTVSPTATGTAVSKKDGYTTITIGGIKCSYPSEFHSNTVSGNNEKLNLTDPLGGAQMLVYQEGKAGNPTELMKDYARQKGGNVLYSRAGDDWYAVTVESGSNVYHRKCIVRNGISVYYDFTYSATSSSKAKYEGYIEDIDAEFK